MAKNQRVQGYIDEDIKERWERFKTGTGFASDSAALDHCVRQEIVRFEGKSSRQAALDGIVAFQGDIESRLGKIEQDLAATKRTSSIALLVQWFRMPAAVEITQEQVEELKQYFDSTFVEMLIGAR